VLNREQQALRPTLWQEGEGEADMRIEFVYLPKAVHARNVFIAPAADGHAGATLIPGTGYHFG
jgi:hypothetical protein